MRVGSTDNWAGALFTSIVGVGVGISICVGICVSICICVSISICVGVGICVGICVSVGVGISFSLIHVMFASRSGSWVGDNNGD